MLCDDADWGNLNLTDVYEPDVQHYFCTLDMEKLAMDVYSVVDVMGMIAMVRMVVKRIK